MCISSGNVLGIKIRIESSDILTSRDYNECQEESGCYVGHNRNVIELTLLYLLIHLPSPVINTLLSMGLSHVHQYTA